MQKTDRWLVGIVVGALALVGLALAVARSRPLPDYRSDDSPEAAAFNYFLALRRNDYAAAWALLSEALPGRPATVDAFVADLSDWLGARSALAEAEIEVHPAQVVGDTALVDLTLVSYPSGGLFGGGLIGGERASASYRIRAVREAAGWRIADGGPAFVRCWQDPDAPGCPEERRSDPAPAVGITPIAPFQGEKTEP